MNEAKHLAIRSHLLQRWPQYKATERQWTIGPVFEVMPDLRILECVSTDAGDPAIYCSSGASDIEFGATYGLEFFLFARDPRIEHVELLSLVTYMHHLPEHHLDVGHTMNIGRPWVQGSTCDRLLVSLPFPGGAQFEYLHVGNTEHVRFLWLLPITAEEEQYRHTYGLEALEQKFDAAGIDFADSTRKSVVQ